MAAISKNIRVLSALRAPLGVLLLALSSTATGCLDRPIGGLTPRTSNALTDQVRTTPVDKIDLLFMIDNSGSMADKQKVLAKAVPDLVGRLVNPLCISPDSKPATNQPKTSNEPCPPGSYREFSPVTDIHVGVITSSLGSHGSDNCTDPPQSDHAHLIHRSPGGPVATYKARDGFDAGFFVWDPEAKQDPPGDAVAQNGTDGLIDRFTQVVVGANQDGCGYEASLESWYRFLIDPRPPLTVNPPSGENQPASVEGVDEDLLRQRAAFLRPDSLVAIINLSDENDCSIIDGALPADVCDDPDLDENGNPVGCKSNRVGWPVGYVEGNFQDLTTDAEGRVTGTPERTNSDATQSTKNGNDFRLHPGTAACASDPTSPECKKDTSRRLPQSADLHSVRCWNQKQRFGVDMLYPTQRYVDGLRKTKVYDRDGFLVANPLFDDLPYKQAEASGTPLKRAKIQRDPSLIIYASIVGVPWQDIARNPDDLSQGYKPVEPPSDEPTSGIDWSLLLGDPRSQDPERHKPVDPLMQESVDPRSGSHPITHEPVGLTTWNKINGHERTPNGEDNTEELQYACTFALSEGDERECASKNPNDPLCENVSDGNGNSNLKQVRAKAFPGTRFLQVAKDFGQNAVVASICTPNLNNNKAADYGYRPAVLAVLDRLKDQLSDRCVPRKLAVNPDGTTPCLIVDAKFPKGAAEQASADDIAACQRCDQPARKPISPELIEQLPEGALQHECLCEVTQLQEPANQAACRTDPNPQLTLPSSAEAGGWCYVDPVTAPAEQQEPAAAIVKKCPTNEKRTIRFLHADTEGATLFITCLGAAEK